MRKWIRAFAPALAAFSLLAPPGASAQYPDRPVRVVLPYPPGGGGDVVLRTLQPGLEKQLGRPIVIEYRAGAAGNIGMGEAARAAPDGYTLVVGPTNNFVINQFLFRNLGIDPLTAFAPVTMLVENPYLVAVSAATPGRTFAEFAAHARANAGKLNFGSPGNATVPHLSGLMLSEHMGAKMTHVPYKGSGPGMQALTANDVQMFLASYGIVSGLASSGKVKLLAVSGTERLTALPDVPSAKEVGLPPDIIYSNWWGLAAPRGTDAAIVNRLAQAVKTAVQDAEVQKRFVNQGAIAIANSPAEFAERMRGEAQSWKTIIEKTGAKVDN